MTKKGRNNGFDPGKPTTVLLVYLFFCIPRSFRNTVAYVHW
jgi:hypothetical protein